MKLLITAATEVELKPLLENLNLSLATGWPRLVEQEYKGHTLLLATTGVGMVSTAATLARLFTLHKVDAALQIGICGSYRPDWPLASLVEVVEDNFAELGAEDADARFIDMHELGFATFEVGVSKYFNTVRNPLLWLNDLAQARGITVNTVTGTEATREARHHRWLADVETMEGAALFQVCLQSGVNFRQVRAVSNYVEPRNRANWQIPQALDALHSWLWANLDTLCKAESWN